MQCTETQSHVILLVKWLCVVLQKGLISAMLYSWLWLYKKMHRPPNIYMLFRGLKHSLALKVQSKTENPWVSSNYRSIRAYLPEHWKSKIVFLSNRQNSYQCAYAAGNNAYVSLLLV